MTVSPVSPVPHDAPVALRISGHIREDQGLDPQGHAVHVTVIQGGRSKNGYMYNEAVLQEIASLLEGAHAYADHARQEADARTRSVRDRTLFGLLARKGDQLAEWLCGYLRRSPRSGSIAESFTHGEIFQRKLLPTQPAHAPTANRVHTRSPFSREFSPWRFPSSAAKIICARRASGCGVLCRRTSASNSLRSASLNLSSAGWGPLIALALFSLAFSSYFTTEGIESPWTRNKIRQQKEQTFQGEKKERAYE